MIRTTRSPQIWHWETATGRILLTFLVSMYNKYYSGGKYTAMHWFLMSAKFVVCLLSLWVTFVLAFVHTNICLSSSREIKAETASPHLKRLWPDWFSIQYWSRDPFVGGKEATWDSRLIRHTDNFERRKVWKSVSPPIAAPLRALKRHLCCRLAFDQRLHLLSRGMGLSRRREGTGWGVEEQTVSVFSHQNPFRIHSITSYCDFRSFPGVKGLCWRQPETVLPHLVAVLCGRQS